MPDIPVTKVTGIAVFACYQGHGYWAYIPVTKVTGITGMPARDLYILRIYTRESGKPSVRVMPTLSVGRLSTPPQRVRSIPVQYSRGGKEG